MYEIESKSGVSIKDFSKYPNEGEILFPTNRKFIVNSIEKDYKFEGGSLVYIKLSEVK